MFRNEIEVVLHLYKDLNLVNPNKQDFYKTQINALSALLKTKTKEYYPEVPKISRNELEKELDRQFKIKWNEGKLLCQLIDDGKKNKESRLAELDRLAKNAQEDGEYRPFLMMIQKLNYVPRHQIEERMRLLEELADLQPNSEACNFYQEQSQDLLHVLINARKQGQPDDHIIYDPKKCNNELLEAQIAFLKNNKSTAEAEKEDTKNELQFIKTVTAKRALVKKQYEELGSLNPDKKAEYYDLSIKLSENLNTGIRWSGWPWLWYTDGELSGLEKLATLLEEQKHSVTMHLPSTQTIREEASIRESLKLRNKIAEGYSALLKIYTKLHKLTQDPEESKTYLEKSQWVRTQSFLFLSAPPSDQAYTDAITEIRKTLTLLQKIIPEKMQRYSPEVTQQNNGNSSINPSVTKP